MKRVHRTNEEFCWMWWRVGCWTWNSIAHLLSINSAILHPTGTACNHGEIAISWRLYRGVGNGEELDMVWTLPSWSHKPHLRDNRVKDQRERWSTSCNQSNVQYMDIEKRCDLCWWQKLPMFFFFQNCSFVSREKESTRENREWCRGGEAREQSFVGKASQHIAQKKEKNAWDMRRYVVWWWWVSKRREKKRKSKVTFLLMGKGQEGVWWGKGG